MTDFNIYTAMAEGTPYKSFIKTTLGKVYVTTLSEVDEKTTKGVILKGNPKKKEDSCIIDLWTEKQYQVFKRLNSLHIKNGLIIEYTRPVEAVEVKQERTIAEWSDQEIFDDLIRAKFPVFVKTLSGIDQIHVLYRILNIATDEGANAKTVERIKARISEVQGTPYEETQLESEE
jgi:hypothetical protein